MIEPPEDGEIIYCKGICGAFIVAPRSMIRKLIPKVRRAMRQYVCERCKKSKCMRPIEQLQKELCP